MSPPIDVVVEMLRSDLATIVIEFPKVVSSHGEAGCNPAEEIMATSGVIVASILIC